MSSEKQNNGGWRFDNSFVTLPQTLFTRPAPVPVRAPKMMIFNRSLAAEMGLDPDVLDSDTGAQILAGNVIPEGADPVAMAYAGHQFGHFTNLGDGRAILIGEHLTPDNRRVDIHFKGSGQTPYSRNGDGRAALGPMLREYLISEAMHALGIPTTRSLAVVTTGETVFRDKPLRGAVLTRVASSHIRVGTFEYLDARGDLDSLRSLSEHTLRRHYPDVDPHDPAALLSSAVGRQASLIAKWMHVGFIHGVMNTDNMALSGETIDYGPCAFMNTWNPATVFSSIDSYGRYAYSNQPSIGLWNLARLAGALLPLLHPDPDKAEERAIAILDSFKEHFDEHYSAGLRNKLGLVTADGADESLFQDLFNWMLDHNADFTNTFAAISRRDSVTRSPIEEPAFVSWHGRWKSRIHTQDISAEDALTRAREHNPAIIPRNHLVEEALSAADDDDMTPFHALLDALQHPYDHEHALTRFTEPPSGDQGHYRTFCGT